MASRYLLPAALILLTLSIDLKGVIGLGPKALIMFFTGTVGIMIGGPLALLAVGAAFPELLQADGPDAVWRGMTTVAGSWIGGGANQAAMKEVFEVGNDVFAQKLLLEKGPKPETVQLYRDQVQQAAAALDYYRNPLLYPSLARPLIMAGNQKRVDAFTGADDSSIDRLKSKIESYEAEHARVITTRDLMLMAMVAFGGTGLAHACAGFIAPMLAEQAPWLSRFSLTSTFFWIVVIATTIGLVVSFTRTRALEDAGASKVGSAFVYILVATIGMHMDIKAVAEAPLLFAVGLVWISIHAGLLLTVGYFIKAPLFFIAVGSQANVGGAASAPVVASAFHPSLAPVGVLLAVLGYALGTYGAWLCGQMMRIVSG